MNEYYLQKHTDMYRPDLDRWWVVEKEILPSGTALFSNRFGPYIHEETAEEVLQLIHEGRLEDK